jgi:hypothetical protein
VSAVRAFTATEWQAFRLARLVAAERMPYFMHALFAAPPVAAPGLGTFAVDAHWRLYADPELLTGPEAWDATTAGAVLLHEVGHLLRDHAPRARVLPTSYVHLAWNLAGDAEINDDLLASGVPLPTGVVTPAALGCPDGGLAEDYYATPPERSTPCTSLIAASRSAVVMDPEVSTTMDTTTDGPRIAGLTTPGTRRRDGRE